MTRADRCTSAIVVALTEGVLAAVVGAVAGAVLVAGDLCFGTAVRRLVLHRDGAVAGALLAAVAVSAALLPLLDRVGLIRSAPPPLLPVGQALGGLAFGVGLGVAGGCIAGLLYRSGGGSIASAIALLGVAAGELAVRRLGVTAALRRVADAGPAVRERTIDGLVGVDALPVGLALAAALGLVAWRWRSPVARWGLALGVVASLAWVAAKQGGYGYGLGYVGTPTRLADGGPWFEPALAAGTIGGAAFAQARRGAWSLLWPGPLRSLRAAVGGVAMGMAGTIAAGCNVGHLIGGVPQRSLGSLWSVLWMAVGVAVVVRVRTAAGRRAPFRADLAARPSSAP